MSQSIGIPLELQILNFDPYQSTKLFLDSYSNISPKNKFKILEQLERKLEGNLNPFCFKLDIKTELKKESATLLSQTITDLRGICLSPNIPNSIKYILLLEFFKVVKTQITIAQPYSLFCLTTEVSKELTDYQIVAYNNHKDDLQTPFKGMITLCKQILLNDFYSIHIRNFLLLSIFPFLNLKQKNSFQSLELPITHFISRLGN